MNKYLIRLIVLFLVPLVIADPTTVSAFTRPQAARMISFATARRIDEETLAPPDLEARFPLAKRGAPYIALIVTEPSAAPKASVSIDQIVREIQARPLKFIGNGFFHRVFASEHWVVKTTQMSVRKGMSKIFVHKLKLALVDLLGKNTPPLVMVTPKNPLSLASQFRSFVIGVLHLIICAILWLIPRSKLETMDVWKEWHIANILAHAEGKRLVREKLPDQFSPATIQIPLTPLRLNRWPWHIQVTEVQERADRDFFEELRTTRIDQLPLKLISFIQLQTNLWENGVFAADLMLQNSGLIGDRKVLLDEGGATDNPAEIRKSLREEMPRHLAHIRLALNSIYPKYPQIIECVMDVLSKAVEESHVRSHWVEPNDPRWDTPLDPAATLPEPKERIYFYYGGHRLDVVASLLGSDQVVLDDGSLGAAERAYDAGKVLVQQPRVSPVIGLENDRTRRVQNLFGQYGLQSNIISAKGITLVPSAWSFYAPELIRDSAKNKGLFELITEALHPLHRGMSNSNTAIDIQFLQKAATAKVKVPGETDWRTIRLTGPYVLERSSERPAIIMTDTSDLYARLIRIDTALRRGELLEMLTPEDVRALNQIIHELLHVLVTGKDEPIQASFIQTVQLVFRLATQHMIDSSALFVSLAPFEVVRTVLSILKRDIHSSAWETDEAERLLTLVQEGILGLRFEDGFVIDSKLLNLSSMITTFFRYKPMARDRKISQLAEQIHKANATLNLEERIKQLSSAYQSAIPHYNGGFEMPATARGTTANPTVSPITNNSPDDFRSWMKSALKAGLLGNTILVRRFLEGDLYLSLSERREIKSQIKNAFHRLVESSRVREEVASPFVEGTVEEKDSRKRRKKPVQLEENSEKKEKEQTINPLNDRERKIVELIMQRMTNKQIAAQLNLLRASIYNNNASICRKLGFPKGASLYDWLKRRAEALAQTPAAMAHSNRDLNGAA